MMAASTLTRKEHRRQDTVIVPVKVGAALAQISVPVIETERLILRRWRDADIAPNTAMLSDPPTARFITADGKPVIDELVGWRNAAIMAGHWVLHGFGMFVVEEKSTSKFVGRVGPWFPPGWPGFEVGWALPANFAATATRLKQHGRRLIGLLRRSSSTGSSIASTAKTRLRRPWPGGSGPNGKARPICSVMPRMCG
jgi:RimJ/RimL family protein N-acetyltransferase